MNKTFKNSKIFWCLAAFAVALNVLFSTPSFAKVQITWRGEQ